MGYIVHDAIVLTGDRKAIDQAHTRAVADELRPTSIVETINAHASFLVPPDGSKEGWDASDRGDDKRDAFTSWLRGQPWEYSIDFVVIHYGGDYDRAEITDYNAAE